MPEKHPSSEPRRSGIDMLPIFIALLLYIAAALKLVKFLQAGVRSDPHFYLAEVLFELILASALLSGFARRIVIKLTGLVFVIFLTVTLDRALHGRHSCGCFGNVKVNPWITSTLDTTIIIAILIHLKQSHINRPLRQGAAGFAALLIAVLVCTGLVVTYFRPAHLLPDGRLIGGHGPVVCNPPSWYGRKLPLMRFIKSAGPLRAGTWLIVMYFHQCPECQAEIRLIDRHLIARIVQHRPLPKVALLQIPPFGTLPRGVPTRYMHLMRMKTSRHWLPPFLPVLIGIHNGSVTRVGTRVPGQWFGFAPSSKVQRGRSGAHRAAASTLRIPAPASPAPHGP
jgi:hypothetical protein